MVIRETPGVFIEEVPDPPASLALDRAVPVFIGYTEKGDARTPTRIESLQAFERIFGGAQPENALTATVVKTSADPATNRAAGLAVEVRLDEDDRSRHILYYALQLFFANGGAAISVVSAGGFTSAGPQLADLEACLEPLAAVAEPPLVVIPEATALGNADFRALTDATLSRCAERGNGFAIIDAHDRGNSFGSATTSVTAAAANFRDQCVGISHLAFGAAYAPHLVTLLGLVVDEAAVTVRSIRDGVLQGPGLTLAALRDTDDRAYRAVTARIRDLRPVLPPSAAVAGVYVRGDAEGGVWKAPANVPVAAVAGPVIEFSPADAERLNIDPVTGKSINTIRRFSGRGTLVWGARTLAGNDNEWRYVSVSRFLLAVSAAARKATERFVFEPNDAATWARVRASLESLLIGQWRAGGLQGAKPEQGFFVSVGLGSTMTEQDVLEGRMIVEIGLAPVRPAEFVILRFAHTMTAG